VTNEEILLRYAQRAAFAAVAEMDAAKLSGPIIIPIKADEPRPPEHYPEYSGHARALH
jgi:hypothetical protein